MAEVNLLDQYPRSTRPIEQRAGRITDLDREVSRRFERDYFDGDRRHGYGGYAYHPRFWQPTVSRVWSYYGLPKEASVLDVGCAKGFLLYDITLLKPSACVAGIDISQYAINEAPTKVRSYLQRASADRLPFASASFDLVLCINTIHNLPLTRCKQAVREIQRVSRKHAFITVDAWRTEGERCKLEQWVLTAQTYMHVDGWKQLFHEVGYEGDYYWFIAE